MIYERKVIIMDKKGFRSDKGYDNRSAGFKKDRGFDNKGGGFKKSAVDASRSVEGRENETDKREGRAVTTGRYGTRSTESPRTEGRGRTIGKSEDRKTTTSEKALIDRADENENTVEGRNPVIETLKSGRTVEKLYIAKGSTEGSIKKIIALAKEKGIVVNEVERIRLDNMSTTGSHQGVIALVTPFIYSEIEDMLQVAKDKGEDPFIVVLDEIEDPHNLGSIIRSVNVLGAHGVIIPKRRSVGVTATVLKSASGAADYTKIAKVTNLTAVIKELKDKGLWIIGADMNGKPCYESNLTGPIALVIGSEGSGISKLVKDNCDMVVSIPVIGEVNSFNASVAAGITMYEIVRQRINKK
jgi:23S rRNA (guanosine2251-2'-O)-methyltransferase